MLSQQPVDLFDIDFRSNWYSPVVDYTRRGLTDTQDRVLAISGIATRYSEASTRHWCTYHSLFRPGTRVTSAEYVAGHWLHLLHQDIIWTLVHTTTSWGWSRPRRFHGPSWAWKSVTSPVSFDYVPKTSRQPETLHSDNIKRFFSDLRRNSWRNRETPNPLFRVIRLQADLADLSAPFGAFRQAVLTLRGLAPEYWIQPAILSSKVGFSVKLDTTLWALRTSWTTTLDLQFFPDSLDLWPYQRSVSLTLILHSSAQCGIRGEYSLPGLVLQLVENRITPRVPRYRRCGVFIMSN
jgi:hypothetical protein